jgi:TRAP-type C4-dicarboxylate transport system permease small subunit
VIRRLRRIMIFADILFILAGLLMVENAYNFLLPFFQNHITNGLNAYIIYIMGKWVVLLLVAAILEVYTTHRISHELEKEAKKR